MGFMLAHILNRAKQHESPQVSRARGGVNAERPPRQSSVVVIKRYFGLLACTLIALYLSLSPLYALLNFQEYASDVPHFMRYVLIPGLIGATFLAVGLFARRSVATGVGIYGLSILLALFFFEGLLTVRSIPVRLGMIGQFSDAQRETLERAGTTIRGFTLRRLNRLSGADDLSKTLLSGFPATQVVLCASQGNVIAYTADRYGFNNPAHLYDGPLDLMLLGNSFVEGFCLPPGEDLASRLRKGGLVAASMGIRGNGPLIELATLGRFGHLLRPRHVVLVFFEGNDWENLEAELTEPWLRGALATDADYGSQSTAQETQQRAAVVIKNETQDPITIADLLTKTEVFRNFVALQQTFMNSDRSTRRSPDLCRSSGRYCTVPKRCHRAGGGPSRSCMCRGSTVFWERFHQTRRSISCVGSCLMQPQRKASKSSTFVRPCATSRSPSACTRRTAISVATEPPLRLM